MQNACSPHPKGPFTNDVSREGEGGGWPISDERRRGCLDLVLTRGGRGVQNPENVADVIYERPLMRFMKADFYFSLFVTKLHAILSSAITGAEKMVCNQRRTEAGASHFFGLCTSATDSKLDDFTAPLAQEMHTCMSSEDRTSSISTIYPRIWEYL